ncbi:hypothetical protein GCM10023191_091630 [Actinoallomurus oryzae]|uniref:Uncharacterized protein n=1 Tax=Actinoallomurus oryzae TaxID=502180 RepID=A0ABP8R5P2_9ACTN
MNDPGLDPDTAERMLRGEPAGPPGLTALLAAASARPVREPDGEEAAVAAFREARSLPSPGPRRIRALAGLKAAAAALVLLLAGGVAVAATGHSRGPARTGYPGRTGAPAGSGRTTGRYGPSLSPPPSPSPRPSTSPTPRTAAASHPTPEAGRSERPSQETETPPGKPKSHTPRDKSTVKVGVPSVRPRKLIGTSPTKKIAQDEADSVAGALGNL